MTDGHDYDDRIARVRRKMEERGLDAFLVTVAENRR